MAAILPNRVQAQSQSHTTTVPSQASITTSVGSKVNQTSKTGKVKVIVRLLPPKMTQEAFMELVTDLLALKGGELLYYWGGKIPKSANKPDTFSRAYIVFEDTAKAKEFDSEFQKSVSLKITTPAMVQMAPYQGMDASAKSIQNAPGVGTIEQDKHFQAFLKNLENPDEPEMFDSIMSMSVRRTTNSDASTTLNENRREEAAKDKAKEGQNAKSLPKTDGKSTKQQEKNAKIGKANRAEAKKSDRSSRPARRTPEPTTNTSFSRDTNKNDKSNNLSSSKGPVSVLKRDFKEGSEGSPSASPSPSPSTADSHAALPPLSADSTQKKKKKEKEKKHKKPRGTAEKPRSKSEEAIDSTKSFKSALEDQNQPSAVKPAADAHKKPTKIPKKHASSPKPEKVTEPKNKGSALTSEMNASPAPGGGDLNGEKSQSRRSPAPSKPKKPREPRPKEPKPSAAPGAPALAEGSTPSKKRREKPKPQLNKSKDAPTTRA